MKTTKTLDFHDYLWVKREKATGKSNNLAIASRFCCIGINREV